MACNTHESKKNIMRKSNEFLPVYHSLPPRFGLFMELRICVVCIQE